MQAVGGNEKIALYQGAANCSSGIRSKVETSAIEGNPDTRLF